MCTYASIAHATGYTPAYVSLILRGKVSSTKANPVVERAARALGYYNTPSTTSGRRIPFDRNRALTLRSMGHSNAEICIALDCSNNTVISNIGKEPIELAIANRNFGKQMRKQYAEGRAAIRSAYKAKVQAQMKNDIEKKLNEIHKIESENGVIYDIMPYLNSLRKAR